MSDELTSAPYVEGDFYVYPAHGGLRLPIVRGGDGTEDVVEDTPTDDAAPVDGTPAPDSEYTPERARGLHAELTKAQQELAEVKNQKELWGRAKQGDLDAMRELELPVDFGDEPTEETEESDDPYSTLEQRIAAQEERDRQRDEQEGVNRFNADLDKLAAEKDTTLTKRERSAIYVETLQGGGNSDALQKVFNDLMDERATQRKAWEAEYFRSKKNAPHVSPGGTGATEVPNWGEMTRQERHERMAERFLQGQADS